MIPLADLIIPEWPVPPRVRSLITTRLGGVSQSAYESLNLGHGTHDDPRAVNANRALLRAHLPSAPVWLRQIHGRMAVRADQTFGLVEADASYTREIGTVCVVLVADCLPVLLCDRAGTVVGIAHAGWRGLCSGIIDSVIEGMAASPRDLIAYLGPAIGPTAFEVGAEVRDAFAAHDPQAISAFAAHGTDKWLADLFELARQRLIAVGVSEIYGGGICTYSDASRFYSYRRDRITGRMAALIWLNETACNALTLDSRREPIMRD